MEVRLMNNKDIKNMTNDELLEKFERLIIHATVTECNTARGTKGVNEQIDKIRDELSKRLNKS